MVLSLALSLPVADKMQYFVHFSFNSTLQLIKGISSDLQKILNYFTDTKIVEFFKMPLALLGLGWASVFPNNLASYLKDLKSSLFEILLLKPAASSLEQNHKLPVVSE